MPAASQTAMTGAGMVLGTPEYMAPELIMGEPFDGRVDQYALAVTVYELLCGRRPFEDETKTKVLVLHTSKAPPRLTEWCPTLPERLSQAVLKGLTKDPNERYATCVELAKAVAAAAEGAVARDDRVRLKCPGAARPARCPRPISPGSKHPARPATCPACKSPIDISSAGRSHPEPGRWHDAVLFPGQSPRAQPGRSEQAAAAGGTTAFSTLPAARAATLRPVPAAGTRRHDGILAPRSTSENNRSRRKQSADRPARLRDGHRTRPAAIGRGRGDRRVQEPGRLPSPKRLEPSATTAGRGSARHRQADADLDRRRRQATVALLLAVALRRSLDRPRQETTTRRRGATETQAANAEPVANASQTRIESVDAPVNSRGARQTRTSMPVRRAAASSAPHRATERGRTQRHPHPQRTWPRRSTLAATKQKTAIARRNIAEVPTRGAPQESRAGQRQFADGRFDLALLEQKPVAAKVTLDKILSSPRSYSNQIVIPAGMYNLAPSQADRAGGLRKWLATERKIGSKKDEQRC